MNADKTTQVQPRVAEQEAGTQVVHKVVREEEITGQDARTQEEQTFII